MRKIDPLVKMRDAAYEAAAPFHRRMKEDLALYNNEEYPDDSTWIKRFTRSVKRSISPQVPNAVNRLLPIFSEQTYRLNLEPLRQKYDEFELMNIEELDHHIKTIEAVNGEAEELRTSVLHNLIYGTCISKAIYDTQRQLVRNITINPLHFAPAPETRESNLDFCDFLVHTTYHNYRTVARKYPNARLKQKPRDDDPTGGNIRVDEIYCQYGCAFDAGVPNAKGDTVTVVILVDDEPYEAIHDPYLWPGAPFSSWKNFLNVTSQQATSFWGGSYGELLEPVQKILDEFLSSYIWITRNLATGRMAVKEGYFDQDSLPTRSGDIIQLKNMAPGDRIGDVMQFINTPEAPVSLLNMIQLMDGVAKEQVPSLAPVLVGESPGASTSGRALSALQSSVLNQLSDNVRDYTEYRERRMRQSVTLIQQFSSVQSAVQRRWRMGYDLRTLSDAAKYQQFMVTSPDLSGLPQTPLGRLQVLRALADLGMHLRPEKALELVGAKRGYGLDDEDVISILTPPAGGSQAGGQQAGIAETITGQEPEG